MRYYSTWRRPDIISNFESSTASGRHPFCEREETQLKSNTMIVKEIKMGKDEVQESIDHYWEILRKDVPLANDPSLAEFIKQVFEAGFWAALVDIFGAEKEPSTEKLSATIHININHDPSKAN